MEQINKPQRQHVGQAGAEEIPRGKIRLVKHTCGDRRENFGQRGRCRHQHDANPESTQSGQARDLTAIPGQFRCRVDNHRRAQ